MTAGAGSCGYGATKPNRSAEGMGRICLNRGRPAGGSRQSKEPTGEPIRPQFNPDLPVTAEAIRPRRSLGLDESTGDTR